MRRPSILSAHIANRGLEHKWTGEAEYHKVTSVMVFTRHWCLQSFRVRWWLRRQRIPYTDVNVDTIGAEGVVLRSEIKERFGHSHLPCLFINGKHVGGWRDVRDLHAHGKLDGLLDEEFKDLEVRAAESPKYMQVPIVVLDSVISPPNPTAGDDTLSPLYPHRAITAVPVLRLFGRTKQDVSVCAHIHGVYPYLLLLPPATYSLSASSCASLSHEIEAAVQSYYHMPSKVQIVHNVTVIQGTPLYAYHAHSRAFLKVQVYHPTYIGRVATVSSSTVTVGGVKWVPHEAHIQFELQFMIDYQLSGMSPLSIEKYSVSAPRTATTDVEIDVKAQHLPLPSFSGVAGPATEDDVVPTMRFVLNSIWKYFARNPDIAGVENLRALLTDVDVRPPHIDARTIEKGDAIVLRMRQALKDLTQPAKTPSCPLTDSSEVPPSEALPWMRDVVRRQQSTTTTDSQQPPVGTLELLHEIREHTFSTLSGLSSEEEEGLGGEDEEEEAGLVHNHVENDLALFMTQPPQQEVSGVVVVGADAPHEVYGIGDCLVTATDRVGRVTATDTSPITVQWYVRCCETAAEGCAVSDQEVFLTSHVGPLNEAVVSRCKVVESWQVVNAVTEDMGTPVFFCRYIYIKESGLFVKSMGANHTAMLLNWDEICHRPPPLLEDKDEVDDDSSILLPSDDYVPSEVSHHECLPPLERVRHTTDRHYFIPATPAPSVAQVQAQPHPMRRDPFPPTGDPRTLRPPLWKSPTLPSSQGYPPYRTLLPVALAPSVEDVIQCGESGAPKLSLDSSLRPYVSITLATHQKEHPKHLTFNQTAQEGSKDDLVRLRCCVVEVLSGSLPAAVIHAVALIVYDTKLGITARYLFVTAVAESAPPVCANVSHFSTEYCIDETALLLSVIRKINAHDPDILLGWEMQRGSLGHMMHRYKVLTGGDVCLGRSEDTRTWVRRETSSVIDPDAPQNPCDTFFEVFATEEQKAKARREQATEVNKAPQPLNLKVTGRILLNMWKIVKTEAKTRSSTLQAGAWVVLKRRLPELTGKSVEKLLHAKEIYTRFSVLQHLTSLATAVLEICIKLDIIVRTAELAQVFGIQFFEVLSRGSQFRVESILLRVARARNFVALSPSKDDVARQNKQEAVPLVMEPASGFYRDPVIVLDFRSLYPSVAIAYNLCFSTCLGKLTRDRKASKKVGVLNGYVVPGHVFTEDVENAINIAANSCMFLDASMRDGLIPSMLRTILRTRAVVNAAKKIADREGDNVQSRILDARQQGLKLLANVTYGYTAATWTGRMPCADIADAIVLYARATLEKTIHAVNNTKRWGTRVVYGDTDSLFVHVPGATLHRAFEVGNEIVAHVKKEHPRPIGLKLEKVYSPCVLVTKKRYAGFMFESADQIIPTFDAKGLECVRRDQTEATSKIMTKVLTTLFQTYDIIRVKEYFQRQVSKMLDGTMAPTEMILRQEVKMGTYKGDRLPPSAEIARQDVVKGYAPPVYGERVPFLIVHSANGPNEALRDMIIHPRVFYHGPREINVDYYIERQIIPSLNRVLGLLHVDTAVWYREIPQRRRSGPAGLIGTKGNRGTLDGFVTSALCLHCKKEKGSGPPRQGLLCRACSGRPQEVLAAAQERMRDVTLRHLALISLCRTCLGGFSGEVHAACVSTDCPISFEKVRVGGLVEQCAQSVADIEELFRPSATTTASTHPGGEVGRNGLRSMKGGKVIKRSRDVIEIE